MKIHGTLPGLYRCVITPSRRNMDYIPLHLEPALVAQLRRIGRRLEPPFTLAFDTPCMKMLAGVTLNGRKYKQGDRYIFLVTHVYTLLAVIFYVDISKYMSANTHIF